MTDFERGSVSMARSSEAMLNLIEKGTWTMEMARAWLMAVIKNEGLDGFKEPNQERWDEVVKK